MVYDLISVQHAVNENVYAPLSQNEFDALCSFAFNIGLDNFRRSQVLKRLNAGAAVQAACAMELWRKADFEGERIVVDTLVRRRAAEKALFLTPPDGDFAPAPSPIIRPVIDLDALDLVPLRRPVELETSFDGDRVRVRREATEEDALPVEPAPEPIPAVTAAAEAVSARLETIFPDPGEEPEAPPELGPSEASPETGEMAADDEPEPGQDLRPQADFAPPITTHREPESGPESDDASRGEAPAFEPEAPSVLDADLDIPRAPPGSEADPGPVVLEVEPRQFIPARERPAPAVGRFRSSGTCCWRCWAWPSSASASSGDSMLGPRRRAGW